MTSSWSFILQLPHFMSNKFFSSQNRVVYKISCKNKVKPDKPQTSIIIRRMCFACGITKTAQHTLRIWNTHCFFTATMVTWTRLSVTLQVRCQSCRAILRPYCTVDRQLFCSDKCILQSCCIRCICLSPIKKNSINTLVGTVEWRNSHTSTQSCNISVNAFFQGLQI